MKNLIFFLLLTFFCPSVGNFKKEQKRFSRVRTAYAEKENFVLGVLNENGIKPENLEIYLRAFKYEKNLELWGKNKSDTVYKLLKTYPICRRSGKLGPKRRQGDRQVPEGFYNIDYFNPASNYYLSLRVSYPNTSDRILGYKSNLGGAIFIHGGCVTIGCIPITDDLIKELYVFCVEAKDKGQTKIPITIYPARLTDNNYRKLTAKYNSDKDKINLWEDLKLAYDRFEATKYPPAVKFRTNGRHEIE